MIDMGEEEKGLENKLKRRLDLRFAMNDVYLKLKPFMANLPKGNKKKVDRMLLDLENIISYGGYDG